MADVSPDGYTKPMEIRNENIEEHDAIYKLTEVAFAPKSFSDGSEPKIISDLRACGDLTLSLVASEGGVLLGHVAFSPVSVGTVSSGWFGLGPISVLPEMQGKGIGSALIKEGLRILQNNGANGCALIGDPNYYSRFGFIADGNVHYQDLPDSHVQWFSFSDEKPEGYLTFSPAFGD